jgi:putative polyhydroxyalkanoate system protein
MADVVVKQPHSLSIEEAKSKMANFEEMMGKYGVKADWSGAKAKLKGTGVSGDIDLSGNMVAVTLKLGMMARAAGVDPSRLKASIEKRLKAAFEG